MLTAARFCVALATGAQVLDLQQCNVTTNPVQCWWCQPPCVDPAGCEIVYAREGPDEDTGSTWVAPDPNEPPLEWYDDPFDLPPAD